MGLGLGLGLGFGLGLGLGIGLGLGLGLGLRLVVRERYVLHKVVAPWSLRGVVVPGMGVGGRRRGRCRG